MTDTPKPFLAAAIQSASIFMDRTRSTDKACELIAEAGRGGARLIVLPEAFIPSYPSWVWVLPLTERAEWGALHRAMVENAVQVPGPETGRLGAAARAAGAWVAIGVDEAGPTGTIYNTILWFDPSGRLVESRRKLMPTGGERMVWKAGEAVPPRVHDTPLGRLGGLLCWENYMPLARYAMYQQGMQVLVAPTWDRAEPWIASMRHIAREGRTYVIGCCQALRRDDIPDSRPFKRFLAADKEWVNDGNSVIVDPDGAVLAGPLAAKAGILYAEIDPGRTLSSKWIFDCVGHYQRDDVFEFRVRGEGVPPAPDAAVRPARARSKPAGTRSGGAGRRAAPERRKPAGSSRARARKR